jgi:hypothetical protein
MARMEVKARAAIMQSRAAKPPMNFVRSVNPDIPEFFPFVSRLLALSVDPA